ncbi:MAG: hypothetical protein IIW56_01425 [Oscillospiraceae bacterium]|jgi:hypothetical protein|nr:hypothetical protein [Oscillospiraceae bacterium]
MDDFENKLGQILGNPEMMGKIMAMAQSFGSQEAPPEPPPQESPMPEIDFATIQKLTGLMGKAGVDSDQKALLCALSPYISPGRIHKLERAMRAAKLAGVATSFLGNTPLFSGR